MWRPWPLCSVVMSCLLSCIVALKLFLLVVINIEYIITSFGTLCFMHIVSGHNFKKKISKVFLTGRVTGYPSQVRLIRKKSGRVTVNPFLLRVKKIRSRLGIFQDFLTRIIMSFLFLCQLIELLFLPCFLHILGERIWQIIHMFLHSNKYILVSQTKLMWWCILDVLLLILSGWKSALGDIKIIFVGEVYLVTTLQN